MSVFSLVFFKVLSSLFNVGIGFLAGKYSNVDRDSIAALLFYFIAPIVFFAIPTSANLTFGVLGITLLTFSICTLLSLACYWLYGNIWQDSHRNILAMSSGTGNSGYVVLPIAAAIFDDYTLSIYALGLIGISLYEMSVGNYYCAMSAGGFRQRIMKVVKLPLINAFFLGCALSLMGFKLPEFLDQFTSDMKGAFSILGMVTIGLALSRVKDFNFDWYFIGAALTSKFIFYPILFNLVILIDYVAFGLFDNSYYNAMQLLCMAPLATNTIVIASLYDIYPEKMATAVLISLVFVLIYMPLMSAILLRNIEISGCA